MIPLSPKHFLFGISGLGITSGGLLAWILATGKKYTTLSFIFKNKTEASQELIREGEQKCGGSVWMNGGSASITSDYYQKRTNNRGKNWNEYQSCLGSILKEEKYKSWFSTSSKR